MTENFESQVSGISILNDPIRRSLYQLVVRNGEPVSRDEAAEAVGVQRSLAAFHLDKLAHHRKPRSEEGVARTHDGGFLAEGSTAALRP